MTGHPPELATDTCARRLRALDVLDVARPEITWHGPARFPADRPASEATVQALCGLMEVHGRDRGAPRRLGLEVASVAAGILAAQGALAAAIGGRREVRTSVLQAGLVLLSHYFVVATGLGDALPGSPLPAPGPPFRAAGGEWFEIETLDAESWKAFWTALGVAGADLGRGWHVFRLRYERATCSLPPGLHEATASRSLDDLRRVASATGVSMTPLRSYAEVLADRPVDRAMVQARGDAAPPSADEVSGELPLAGIRMVEATSRIQGPFAGMLLRMLGAEVVRVQPPEGDYGRAAVTLHRAKDAVALDLGSGAGRAELVDLVSGADVFLHNWRPGKAAEWGLEFDDLARCRPGLVYAGVSGWGDRADVRHLLGTDFLVQAYAGLGEWLHAEDEPPFPSRMILCDLFGALVATEGVLAGLHRRQRAGRAQEVRSSLLAGAMALQAHVLDDPGRHRPAWGPLDRPLPTAGGHLMADDATAVAGHLHERTAAQWEDELLAAGIPAAVVCEHLASVPADPRLSDLFEPVGGGFAPRSPWSFT